MYNLPIGRKRSALCAANEDRRLFHYERAARFQLRHSLETLISIGNNNSKTAPYIINEIRNQLHRLRTRVNVVWIPAHKGIPDHDITDAEARMATNHDRVDIPIPISVKDANNLIKEYINHIWQQRWSDSNKGREYNAIEPSASRNIKYTNNNRQREVIATRLRFRKCKLIHYLQIIGKHNDGNCDICRVPETVEHFIMHCRQNKTLIEKLNVYRRTLGNEVTLADSLKNKTMLNIIIDFIIDSKRKI